MSPKAIKPRLAERRDFDETPGDDRDARPSWSKKYGWNVFKFDLMAIGIYLLMASVFLFLSVPWLGRVVKAGCITYYPKFSTLGRTYCLGVDGDFWLFVLAPIVLLGRGLFFIFLAARVCLDSWQDFRNSH